MHIEKANILDDKMAELPARNSNKKMKITTHDKKIMKKESKVETKSLDINETRPEQALLKALIIENLENAPEGISEDTCCIINEIDNNCEPTIESQASSINKCEEDYARAVSLMTKIPKLMDSDEANHVNKKIKLEKSPGEPDNMKDNKTTETTNLIKDMHTILKNDKSKEIIRLTSVTNLISRSTRLLSIETKNDNTSLRQTKSRMIEFEKEQGWNEHHSSSIWYSETIDTTFIEFASMTDKKEFIKSESNATIAGHVYNIDRDSIFNFKRKPVRLIIQANNRISTG